MAKPRVKRIQGARESKGKSISKSESLRKDMMYCPLCNQHKHQKLFAHHRSLNYFICSDCGVMFMNPEHVKELLGQIEKDKKDKRIITRDDGIITT